MAVTKQQLQQQVEALRAECDRLRTENAALRSAAHAPTSDRRALLAAAKAEAIRTGRMVKV